MNLTNVELKQIEFSALKPIIEKEIEEVRVAIDNELLWALGSETEEQQMQHNMNAQDLIEYTQTLQYYLDNMERLHTTTIFMNSGLKDTHEFWIKKLLEEASSKEVSK